jgi:hypothetical protein
MEGEAYSRRQLGRNGVKLGRKSKLTPHQLKEAIERRNVKGETLTSIAKSHAVNYTTIIHQVRQAT